MTEALFRIAKLLLYIYLAYFIYKPLLLHYYTLLYYSYMYVIIITLYTYTCIHYINSAIREGAESKIWQRLKYFQSIRKQRLKAVNGSINKNNKRKG